jgi:hypothetical protein
VGKAGLGAAKTKPETLRRLDRTFTDTTTNTTLGTNTLNSGQAMLSISTLTVGSHSISASYSGYTHFGTSSANLTGGPEVINKANSQANNLMSSPSPSVVGQSVTFTVTESGQMTGGGSAPSGTVTFLENGSTTLGTATLNSSGQATFSFTFQVAGSPQITVSYPGDGNYNSNTSSPWTQHVNNPTPSITSVTNGDEPCCHFRRGNAGFSRMKTDSDIDVSMLGAQRERGLRLIDNAMSGGAFECYNWQMAPSFVQKIFG